MMEKDVDIQQVRKHFSCHAQEYDRYAIVQQVVAKRLAGLLGGQQQSWQRALEVGCGTGFLSQELLRLQTPLSLVLSDIAHGMSQYVQQAQPQASVCDADASALPFAAGSFDLVASSSVYQWLNDLPLAFKQLSHVLKKDGLLALALFGEKTLYELRNSYQAVLPLGKTSHVQCFPALETVASAIGGGFEVLSLHSEFEVEWHADVPALLRGLKKIGAQNASQQRPQGLASRQVMHAMISHYLNLYGKKQGIPATYEAIYLLARRR
ncbi:malonyl-ACP O-methyltransferase BioC [Malonomonas rubra]|uniref:malonyl-ACP O-methyltransferase BioC n=1 Tax=Malonomonas rubra TaxID=57040 RepID=UPI0026EA3114|nr:malonyl-ACP O-methyltransferase BioC [Malonomonas rubra]